MNYKKNFRSNYLRSVRVSVVEESERLELWKQEFNEPEIDKERIMTLGRTIGIEGHRASVWMLLLGIRPVYRKSWEKVEQAQLEHYHDIKRCVYLICNVRKARQNPKAIDRETLETGLDNITSDGSKSFEVLKLWQIYTNYKQISAESTYDNHHGTGNSPMASYNNNLLQSVENIVISVMKEESKAYWCLAAIMERFIDTRLLNITGDKAITVNDIDALLLK